MARTLIQLCQGLRPIGSTGGAGSQCFNCLLHGGSPGLVVVHLYQGYNVLSILSGISCADQYVGNIVVGLLNASPDLKPTYGKQFCRGMARELKVIKAGADIKISPQGGQIPLPSLHFVCKESILGNHMISVKM